MDEIPAWALEKAREAVAKQRKHEGIAQVVARALVAERERAAKIADAYAKENGQNDEFDEVGAIREVSAESIAAAIRKGE